MDFTKYFSRQTIAASGSGTTQGTNTLTTNFTQFTAASSGAACTLPANLAVGIAVVANLDASNAMVVFPPVGGKINNGSANASVALAAGKVRVFVPVSDDGLNWISVLGA